MFSANRNDVTFSVRFRNKQQPTCYFTGFYIYAETSRPRVQGNRAVLMSPRLTGPYCLRFHFHMLGITMGSLKVYQNSGSTLTEVFSLNGNQGDRWYMAQTSLTGPDTFQVMIKSLLD